MVNSNSTHDTIQKLISAMLPDARILLFGSRARGNYDASSDYDLMVITPNLLSRSEKLSSGKKLHTAIMKAINAPIDLLFFSEEEVAQKRELPGHIVRIALKEGVTL
jgi:predicted nucleotidyltransferase